MTGSAPIATFVVPCRNGARHVEALITSLLAQTRGDFVLVLADNASEDDSVERAERVAGSRIQIERRDQPLGMAANWNRAASFVRTPYCCLAHVDDLYAPDYLERMMSALESRPQAGLAHCRARALDDDGNVVDSAIERYKERWWHRLANEHWSRAETYAALYEGNFVACPSILYRTEALRAIGPFREDLDFAPDWELAFRVLLAGWNLAAVPDALLRYRRHGASVTAASTASMARYREELRICEWARTAGIAAGLLPPSRPRSRAARNNLLHDACVDVRAGAPARARERLRFGRRLLPGARYDGPLAVVWLLTWLGRAAAPLLDLGLWAAAKLPLRAVPHRRAGEPVRARGAAS